MLKVIFRILVIMLIIALLGGAFYTLVQNTSLVASSGRGGFGNRTFTGSLPATATSGTITGQGFSPNRFGEGGGEGRFNFSLSRGLAGVLGNSIAIASITLVVVLVRRQRMPRRLHVRPVSLDQP
jgi:hypothetical protein